MGVKVTENQLSIGGRATRLGQFRLTATGMEVYTLDVAHNHAKAESSGEKSKGKRDYKDEKTSFLQFKFFGPHDVAKVFNKDSNMHLVGVGDKVEATGKLLIRKYFDEYKNEKTVVELQVRTFDFERRTEKEPLPESEPTSEPQAESLDDEEIPPFE